MPSQQDNRETTRDVPVRPEEDEDRSWRIRSRATYFKEIQRRAGRTTDVESQRAAERRRQESKELKEYLGVDTSQNTERMPLKVEVCHGKRYVYRECGDVRHRINDRRSSRISRSRTRENTYHPSATSSRNEEQRRSPQKRRMPEGFFGVSSCTPDVKKQGEKRAEKTSFCTHCGKQTSSDHAEEHQFQQMAEEFDQPEMSEIDFVANVQQENPVEESTASNSHIQRTEVVAEEESLQEMREDLIRQANWMKLQNFMYKEAASEEEVIRAWYAEHVKTNTSFRYMRAKPVQAKKIVVFLLRIKEMIKDDEAMMRAWRERLQ